MIWINSCCCMPISKLVRRKDSTFFFSSSSSSKNLNNLSSMTLEMFELRSVPLLHWSMDVIHFHLCVVAYLLTLLSYGNQWTIFFCAIYFGFIWRDVKLAFLFGWIDVSMWHLRCPFNRLFSVYAFELRVMILVIFSHRSRHCR